MADILDIISKEQVDRLYKVIEGVDLLNTKLTENIKILGSSGEKAKVLADAQREAEKISKEQAATLREIEKERKKAEAAAAKQAAKEKEMADAIAKEAKSIAELKTQNKALLAQRDAIRNVTKETQREINQLNARIEANNKLILQNSNAMEKQRANIGNYKSAIEGAKSAFGALGIAMGAAAFVSITRDAVNAAASLEGVSRAFNRLESADDLMERMKTATRGTVSEFELMKGAVKWDNFRLPMDKLPAALEFARKRAADTGESLDYLVESIVKGLGRQSPLILDNLGLSVTEINNEVARTGDFFEGVFSVIEKENAAAQDAMGSTKESIGKMNVSVEDLKLSWGQLVGSFANTGAFSILIGTINNIKGVLDKLGGEGSVLEKIWEIVKWFATGAVLGQGVKSLLNNWFGWFSDAEDAAPAVDEMTDSIGENAKKAVEIKKTYGEISDEIELYKQKLLASITAGDGNAESIAEQIKALEAQKKAIDDQNDALLGTEKTNKEAEKRKKEAEDREKEREKIIEMQTNRIIKQDQALQSWIHNLSKFNEELPEPEFPDIEQKIEDPWYTALDNVKNASKDAFDATTEGQLLSLNEQLSQLDYYHSLALISEEEYQARRQELEKQTSEVKLQEAQKYVNAIADLGNTLLEFNQFLIDTETQRLEQQKQYELSLVGDNAAKKQAIERRYAEEEKKLKIKQAKQDKAQALFSAIIKTAQAVIAGLAFGPPLGYVFAALNAVLGGIQIGLIASQPLPQYAKGTKRARGGLAVVGEKGRELIMGPDGSIALSPSTASLVNLGRGGHRIIPNRETEALLRAARGADDPAALRMLNEIKAGNDRLVKAIQDKSEVHISRDGHRITERRGAYARTWYDKKVRI